MTVEGDGYRYKFVARDDSNVMGIAWSSSFNTIPGVIIDVEIPWGQLTPTLFGDTVMINTPFNTKTIAAIQFVYSKYEYDGSLNPNFQEGSFHLEVKQISFY